MYEFLFVARKHKSHVVDPAVFTCISMLAKAVGPMVAKEIKELLDQMLACGLRYVDNHGQSMCRNYEPQNFSIVIISIHS